MRLVGLSTGIVLFVIVAVACAAEEIRITTTDGVEIHGSYYAPTSPTAPGLILLHMLGKSRHSWETFAAEAVNAGYAVLAIDFRGHGGSVTGRSGEVNLKSMTEKDFGAMAVDVRAAVEWLRQRPEVVDSEVGIVGASIGANLALSYAAEDPIIAAVVLLSPGEVYRGVKAEPALRTYGRRPLLIVAAEDDNYSLVSARALGSLMADPKQVIILPQGGHGTYMLGQVPELSGTLLNFLNAYLR